VIVEARRQHPLRTTQDLIQVLEQAVPPHLRFEKESGPAGGRLPARNIPSGRIGVNEAGCLKRGYGRGVPASFEGWASGCY
jgi:16S rRNA C1402 N4-methylase RsmH